MQILFVILIILFRRMLRIVIHKISILSSMVEIIGNLQGKKIHDLRSTVNDILVFTDCLCDFLKAIFREVAYFLSQFILLLKRVMTYFYKKVFFNFSQKLQRFMPCDRNFIECVEYANKGQ